MRIIAVTNQKGGSGKTTTVVSVAAALGEKKKKKVLVLDLDPQASASKWVGVHDGEKALFEVFTEGRDLAEIVTETETKGVDLVPASSWLVGLERAMAGEPGAETILRNGLERLPAKWDFVLIDCPPSLGFLAVSALTAAKEVLVPVEATVMALDGLAALLTTVERVKERLNPGLAVSAILVCRTRRTNLAGEVEERLRGRFDGLVLKTTVRENVRLAEAPSFAQAITSYDNRSPGAQDYRSVAAELLKRKK